MSAITHAAFSAAPSCCCCLRCWLSSLPDVSTDEAAHTAEGTAADPGDTAADTEATADPGVTAGTAVDSGAGGMATLATADNGDDKQEAGTDHIVLQHMFVTCHDCT